MTKHVKKLLDYLKPCGYSLYDLIQDVRELSKEPGFYADNIEARKILIDRIMTGPAGIIPVSECVGNRKMRVSKRSAPV
jgi:hypothetical protein